MIIKSLCGKTLYQSEHKTLRASLEEGVAKGVDFCQADLRRARLSNATLDGLQARDASLWGAELDGADIGLADLRDADMRCANLKDTCLAESDLSGADLRGAYFIGTLVERAVLDGITVSCPTFWDLDLAGVASLKGAVYAHHGEKNMPVRASSWVIRSGLGPKIIINGQTCLWEGRLYNGKGQDIPPMLKKSLTDLKDCAEHLLSLGFSQDATRPIPKRVRKASEL